MRGTGGGVSLNIGTLIGRVCVLGVTGAGMLVGGSTDSATPREDLRVERLRPEGVEVDTDKAKG